MSAGTQNIGGPQTLQTLPAYWYCMACHVKIFWNFWKKKCIPNISCKLIRLDLLTPYYSSLHVFEQKAAASKEDWWHTVRHPECNFGILSPSAWKLSVHIIRSRPGRRRWNRCRFWVAAGWSLVWKTRKCRGIRQPSRKCLGPCVAILVDFFCLLN